MLAATAPLGRICGKSGWDSGRVFSGEGQLPFKLPETLLSLARLRRVCLVSVSKLDAENMHRRVEACEQLARRGAGTLSPRSKRNSIPGVIKLNASNPGASPLRGVNARSGTSSFGHNETRITALAGKLPPGKKRRVGSRYSPREIPVTGPASSLH